VVSVPVVTGYSTSAMVGKIRKLSGTEH